MTKQRMYNVVRVRDDKGTTTQLNATPMTHDEACTFLSKQTKYKWCRDMLVEVNKWTEQREAREAYEHACALEMQDDVVAPALADAPTVQQVPAQSVYTLELEIAGDVASKEYMDYTRAKQAFEDAVRNVHVNVTRLELFSEAVGSMDKWERK